MNTYEHIIELDNIREAYLEVVQKLEESNRTYRYRAIDGYTLSDYDFISEQLIQDIQTEIIQEKKITPALEMHIPKRNKPGTRPVYIHTIKERVKAQAIYRVIAPIFDDYFSPYLFSYRTSHPHYKAIRTIVRKYKRDPSGYMIIGDISSYSDIINPDILKQQIKKIGFEQKVNSLLDLYVDAQLIEKGIISSSPHGIITGLPITVMFNNLYLDYFDKQIGGQVALYRRVGDDFIAFDTYENLQSIHKKMVALLVNVKIQPEYQKISLQKTSEPFTFLGYLFCNGVISIPHQSIKNIQIHIRKSLAFYQFNTQQEKVTLFKKKLFQGTSLKHYFIQIIRQYNHVNDVEQIKFLSQYFYKRVVIYFFGSYSSRNHRKTKKLLKDKKINTPSLMKYYIAFHTGAYKGKYLKYIK
ncbi:MAG: hypothetical protein KDC81_15195 [Flavobacteriaceae bacterium]|nr:hypothetical protein [Flavobacteriaceae bacterium]